MIAFSETPMISISCSRNWRWTTVKGWNDASSITPSTCSSNTTGRITMVSGEASPSPEEIFR